MKEKKYVRADEKRQGEENSEEMSQTAGVGILDASSKSCLQSCLCLNCHRLLFIQQGK